METKSVRVVLLAPIRHWDSPESEYKGKKQPSAHYVTVQFYDFTVGDVMQFHIKADQVNLSVLETAFPEFKPGGKIQVINLIYDFVQSGQVFKRKFKSYDLAEVMMIAKK